jgi:GAF domain-containing protein
VPLAGRRRDLDAARFTSHDKTMTHPSADPIEDACQHADRLITGNAPRHEILGCLIAAAERCAGSGAVSSVLVLDQHGLLRNGASPNLPADYLRAIDGLKPDPSVGTCAAAAATGAEVITPSFLADGKWAELRHLPLAIGFAGAWSVPIKSPADGRVLGTFGTYYREVRQPSARELAAVRTLAATAARALDRRERPS